MPKHKMIIPLLLLSGFSLTTVATEFPAIAGDHAFGMRTRYQSIGDDLLGDALAFTSRFTLTSRFKLDEQAQWQLLLQPNYVYAFNEEDYNSVTVTRFTSPIPDPDGFNLTQGFIHYDSNNYWSASLGRQSISFDNERMVGAIEFWQTPQSFDALKLQYNNQQNINIQYLYSNKVHRIFGQDSNHELPKDDVRFGHLEQRPASELGEHRLNSHLLNIEYKTENDLTLSGYHYYIDNQDQPLFSTATTGIRIRDEFKPGKIKYRYVLEYAHQQDSANNLKNYQAWYSLFEFGLQYKSHRFDISQEILSEDDYNGFQTPLATNHKFQGWADVFASYGMQAGLRDKYVTYRGRANKLNWRVVYHQFDSYSHSDNIGAEIDFELGYRFTRKWEIKLVYADYRSNDGMQYFSRASYDLNSWFASIAYNI